MKDSLIETFILHSYERTRHTYMAIWIYIVIYVIKQLTNLLVSGVQQSDSVIYIYIYIYICIYRFSNSFPT